MSAALRDTLANAALAHIARNGRRFSNPTAAAALTLRRLDDYVLPEIAGGSSVARALYDNFNDRLLTALEKAAGVPVTLGGGGHDKGRPT